MGKIKLKNGRHHNPETKGKHWNLRAVSIGTMLCMCATCLFACSWSEAQPGSSRTETPSGDLFPEANLVQDTVSIPWRSILDEGQEADRYPGRRSPVAVRLGKNESDNRDESQTFNVSPAQEVYGCPGDTISVPIMLTDPPEPVDAFVLDLTYSHDLLSYMTVEVSGSLTENWFMVAGNENSPGEVTIGGFNTDGITESGILFSILFTVGEGTTGQGSLCLSNFGDKLTGADSQCGTFSSADCPTSIENRGDITAHSLPTFLSLEQNYPNPFNASTDIRFQIADSRSPVPVTLNIYNTLGHSVITLMNEIREAGTYTVNWNGRDGHGREVSSGIYFCRLSVNGERWTETRRMVLMK